MGTVTDLKFENLFFLLLPLFIGETNPIFALSGNILVEKPLLFAPDKGCERIFAANLTRFLGILSIPVAFFRIYISKKFIYTCHCYRSKLHGVTKL